jgi:HipA-like protein
MRYSAPPPTLQVLFEGEPVAELSKGREDRFVFHYLPAFKAKKLAPLPGFQDVDRMYESADLFPFFAERIPDLRRPEIREWIKTQNLDDANKLELLGALSRHSVTDSFELRIKAA